LVVKSGRPLSLHPCLSGFGETVTWRAGGPYAPIDCYGNQRKESVQRSRKALAKLAHPFSTKDGQVWLVPPTPRFGAAAQKEGAREALAAHAAGPLAGLCAGFSRQRRRRLRYHGGAASGGPLRPVRPAVLAAFHFVNDNFTNAAHRLLLIAPLGVTSTSRSVSGENCSQKDSKL
jgi:hypothetical protein